MKLRHSDALIDPRAVWLVVSAIEKVADDGAVRLKLDGREVAVQVPLEQVPWLQRLLAWRRPGGER